MKTYLPVLGSSVFVVEPSVIEVTISANSGLPRIVRVNLSSRRLLLLMNGSIWELDE